VPSTRMSRKPISSVSLRILRKIYPPQRSGRCWQPKGPTQGAILGTTIATAAWHNKPSWFVIASNDRAISPEQEMATAKRMNAKTLRS
jgi:hypothetical protein